MGVIINEADRMTRIVQDLLTLSKFDSGKLDMNISRFSFSQAAAKRLPGCRAMDAKRHGHTLSCSILQTLPEVNGDRERIEQVIMNIVSNAIKYTPDGGSIDIATGMDKESVWVRVQDNGIGIPEAGSAPVVRTLLPGGQSPLQRVRRNRPGTFHCKRNFKPAPGTHRN